MTGWRKRQIENLIAGAEIHDDKGYQIADLSKIPRDTRVYDLDMPTILLKGLKDLTLQVEDLKTRINRLENQQRDDGK